MADEDVVVAEVEAPPIEPNNPIEDFLKAIEDQKYTDAENQFNDMVNDRLQAQLDQARAKIAGQIYGEEELEDAIDEVESEEEVEEPEDEVELTDDEQDADDENVAGV